MKLSDANYIESNYLFTCGYFFLGKHLILRGQMAEYPHGTPVLCCLLFFGAVNSKQSNSFLSSVDGSDCFSSVHCRGGEGIGKEGHEECSEQFPPGPRVANQNANIEESCRKQRCQRGLGDCTCSRPGGMW